MLVSIIRSLQGHASAAEEQQLAAWRAAADENEREYRVVARIWELTARARSLVQHGPPPSAAEVIARSEAASVPWRRTWLPPWAAAAALVVLGLGIAEVWHRVRVWNTDSAAAEFTTGRSEMATVRLPDNTVVRLGQQSRLRLRDGKREVWIDGHAFFAVARQNGKPFRVRTALGEVVVLGTRFDVRSRADGLQLVVVEGRVAVRSKGGAVELGAHQMSRVAQGRAPSVEPVGDMDAVLAWMRNALVFSRTPLNQVAAELERRYGVPVVLADSALAGRTVTASFTDADLSEVLNVICRATRTRCSQTDSLASIRP